MQGNSNLYKSVRRLTTIITIQISTLNPISFVRNNSGFCGQYSLLLLAAFPSSPLLIFSCNILLFPPSQVIIREALPPNPTQPNPTQPTFLLPLSQTSRRNRTAYLKGKKSGKLLTEIPKDLPRRNKE